MLLFAALPWSRKAGGRPGRIERARTRRSGLVLGLVHLTALVAPAWAALSSPDPDFPSEIAWIGVGLMIAALGLQQWAQRSLGKSYTLVLQTSEQQALSQAGPYARIRHPAYLAQIILWIGLGLTSQSLWAPGVTAVVAIAGYAYRIREEERMLLAVFGDKYESYAAARKRLVPLIW